MARAEKFLWEFNHDTQKWFRLCDVNATNQKYWLATFQHDRPGSSFAVSPTMPDAPPKMGKMTVAKDGTVKQNPKSKRRIVRVKVTAAAKNPAVGKLALMKDPDKPYVLQASNDGRRWRAIRGFRGPGSAQQRFDLMRVESPDTYWRVIDTRAKA